MTLGRLILGMLLTLSVAVWVAAETQVTGDVEVGYQAKDLSANESKFEEYGEVPSGVVIPHVQIQSTGDHDQVSFEGSNIRQNNQSFDLNYNHDYKFKIDASWEETPHDYSNVGQTLYTPSAPGVLTLPTGIKGAFSQSATVSAATQNLTLSSFTALAHDAGLHIQDNKGSIHLGFRAGEHIKYDIGITEDRIEGSKPKAYTFGSGLQLPVPVDWKVYNMHAGTQYASKDAQFAVNYLMSAFNNDIETLIWDNPKRLTDSVNLGPAQGKTALAPDNFSQTINISGGMNLPAKTRVTAKGSMGYLRQNQDLLYYTNNSAALGISTNTLPEQSANTKMLTWTQDYAMTNRYWKPLALGVRYHSYQLLNRAPELTFSRSLFDTNITPNAGVTERFEFRKDTLEGNLDYEILRPWSLGVRYATEWDHRTAREIRDTTEKTLTVTTDVKPTRASLLRGTYVRAHRRPQDFVGEGIFEEAEEGLPNTFEEPPGLRRYDSSDRFRNQGKVLAQWNPGPVMLEFNGSLTHDNFQPGIGDLLEGSTNQAQMYGLLESRDYAAGGSIGWDIMERLSLDAYYQYDESKGIQRGSRASNTAAAIQTPSFDWSARSVDRYHSAGASANIGKPADRVGVRIGYDVVISRGANNYLNIGSAVTTATVTPAAAAGVLISPPDTKYMKQDISLKTTCRVSDRVSLVFGYLFEKFDVSNWQYQNIPLVGGTAAGQGNIYLATNLQNYVAHVGSIVARYKF